MSFSEEEEEVVVSGRRSKVAKRDVDAVALDMLRNGEWRVVLSNVGSEKYNELCRKLHR